MSESLDRSQKILGCAIFALFGAAVLVYLHGPGLSGASNYHGDLTQSPHWVAYHGDAFPNDDLLVEYATYNETPVQNAIYWVGTWFVEIVPLNKLVGIAFYGLTAALFFLVVSSMSGARAGVLAALFFTIFPRSSYEIAGGFSKAWAIGLTLLGVYVVETRRWRILLWLMPLAALAYPVSPVLIGAIVLVGLVMEYPRAADQAIRGLKYLTGASALALVPLLYKYFTPPAAIGEMISTTTMRAMWAKGQNSDVTLPLWEEVLSYLEHPFFVYSTVLLLMLLVRRGLVWKRSWTALVIASTVCYYVADFVAPRLYLPDRYTRFSIAVLLVLWHAHNWSRVLDVLQRRWVHRTAMAAVVVLVAAGFPGAFEPTDGDKSLGRWEDRGKVAFVSRVVASLAPPVYVAGHPYHLGDIMVQSKRPVLIIHRMFHAWFIEYRAAVDSRIRDTFVALYAQDVRDVNRLVERYGVTHLVVPRNIYGDRRFTSSKIYERPEYHALISRLADDSSDFLLNPPPRSAVLFEDYRFWLVRLPLEEPPASGDVPRGPVSGPAREGQR